MGQVAFLVACVCLSLPARPPVITGGSHSVHACQAGYIIMEEASGVCGAAKEIRQTNCVINKSAGWTFIWTFCDTSRRTQMSIIFYLASFGNIIIVN